MIEVLKVCPPLKLTVFVDDITAVMETQNGELTQIAEKVMRTIKRQIEKKGLELSITQGGKEGKSRAIVSCGSVEEELSRSAERD